MLPRRYVALAALAGLLAVASTAGACIQVYPYSEICRHGVVGFVENLLP